MDFRMFQIDDQVEEFDVDVDEVVAEELPLITRSSVQQDRQREEEGVRISLPWTKGAAIVKMLTAEEVISAGWLPQELKVVVGKIIGGAGPTKVKTPLDAFNHIKSLGFEEQRLADAMVVHGFISPQVVAKPEDLDPDRDDQIVVTQLHKNDRRAYMRLVMQDRSNETAEVLQSFR